MCVMCVMTAARGRRALRRAPRFRDRPGAPDPGAWRAQDLRWLALNCSCSVGHRTQAGPGGEGQTPPCPQHLPAPCPRPGNRYSIGRRSFGLAADRRRRKNAPPARVSASVERPATTRHPIGMYARQTRRREPRRSASIRRAPGSVITSRRPRFKRNDRLPRAWPRIAPRYGSLRPALRHVPFLSRPCPVFRRGLEGIACSEQQGAGFKSFAAGTLSTGRPPRAENFGLA